MKFRATHPYPIEPDFDISVNLTVTATPPASKSKSKTQHTNNSKSDDSSPKKQIQNNSNLNVKPIEIQTKSSTIHILQPHVHLRHDTILSNEEVECKNKNKHRNIEIQKQLSVRSTYDKLFEGAGPLIRTLTVHGDNELNDITFESEYGSDVPLEEIDLDTALIDAIDGISPNSILSEEIVSTEKTYYNAIKTLLNELIIAMFENKYIEQSYYNKIVSTIPKMIEFHKII